MTRPISSRVSTALFVDVSHRVGRFDLEARSAAALDAGFDGLEQCVCAGDRHRLNEQRAGAPERGVEGRCEASVLALATQLAQVEIDDAAEVVRSLLDIAVNLNATCVNLTLPPLASVANRAGATGFAGYQESVNYTYRLLRRLRYDAESSGVTVNVQGAAGGCLLSPVELRELIDAVNSWAVGVCLDTRHVSRVGDPVDWLVTLGRRVHAVRVWLEAPMHPPGERTVAGATSVEGLRNALKEIHYHGLIIAAGPRPPLELREQLGALL